MSSFDDYKVVSESNSGELKYANGDFGWNFIQKEPSNTAKKRPKYNVGIQIRGFDNHVRFTAGSVIASDILYSGRYGLSSEQIDDREEFLRKNAVPITYGVWTFRKDSDFIEIAKAQRVLFGSNSNIDSNNMFYYTYYDEQIFGVSTWKATLGKPSLRDRRGAPKYNSYKNGSPMKKG